jgi:hypothetical protein
VKQYSLYTPLIPLLPEQDFGNWQNVKNESFGKTVQALSITTPHEIGFWRWKTAVRNMR